MTGRALVAQADALHLPLGDESVDLVVTSPPYWQLRDYDAPGQIGSEPDPAAFLYALWKVAAECKRVLKPGGSMFFNLGDTYAARANDGPSSRPGSSDGVFSRAERPRRPKRFGTVREKSLHGIPWAFALGTTGMLASLGGPDPGLDLIWRAEIIWQKVNGLPESVRDRVRRSHEVLLHFTKSARYYSAVDEVREPHLVESHARQARSPFIGMQGVRGEPNGRANTGRQDQALHPLGKLPGSVWAIPSEPLDLPGYFVFRDGRLVDFLAPSRGGARPRANGHHPGLFDSGAYREVVASGDGNAWRWSRATGVTSSPWPQTDAGLQLRVAASHYAAFPSRLPELIVRGWSPPGICLACEQGRWPVVDRQREGGRVRPEIDVQARGIGENGTGFLAAGALSQYSTTATILGYACACTPYTDHPGTGEPSGPDSRYGDHLAAGNGYPSLAGTPTKRTDGGGGPGLGDRPKVGPWREYHLEGWQAPPTRPAVVLDVCGGTGTTAMVARALGRVGLSFDLSHAYSRAARWRIFESGNAGKALARTNRERQGSLL